MSNHIYTIEPGQHKSKGKRKWLCRYPKRPNRWKIDKPVKVVMHPDCLYNEYEFPRDENGDLESGVNKICGYARITHNEAAFGWMSIVSDWVNSWTLGYKIWWFDKRMRRVDPRDDILSLPHLVPYMYWDRIGKETREEFKINGQTVLIPWPKISKRLYDKLIFYIHFDEITAGADHERMYFHLTRPEGSFLDVTGRTLIAPVTDSVHVDSRYKFGYYLYPYFGGETPNPNKQAMTIELDGLFY